MLELPPGGRKSAASPIATSGSQANEHADSPDSGIWTPASHYGNSAQQSQGGSDRETDRHDNSAAQQRSSENAGRTSHEGPSRHSSGGRTRQEEEAAMRELEALRSRLSEERRELEAAIEMHKAETKELQKQCQEGRQQLLKEAEGLRLVLAEERQKFETQMQCERESLARRIASGKGMTPSEKYQKLVVDDDSPPGES
eukprot:Lankesteria_metandrocarpae@DN6737_c0_g1_i1.p1